MTPINQLLTENKNKYNKLKTMGYIGYRGEELRAIDHREKITNNEADKVIKSVEDLIDDTSYKPFFYKKLYQFGKSLFLTEADKARKYGKKPGQFFTYLLRQREDSDGIS